MIEQNRRSRQRSRVEDGACCGCSAWQTQVHRQRYNAAIPVESSCTELTEYMKLDEELERMCLECSEASQRLEMLTVVKQVNEHASDVIS